MTTIVCYSKPLLKISLRLLSISILDMRVFEYKHEESITQCEKNRDHLSF